MDAEVTKDLIGRSVIQLLELRPLNKITIGEITENAHISRQTFYYHFKDVFDVYKYCVESKLQYPSQDELPSLLDAMLDWMQAFEKLKTFSTAINSSKYQPRLATYLDTINRKTVIAFLKKNPDIAISEDTKMMTVDFLTYAINGTMIKWISRGMNHSAAELCNAIIILITAGLNDITYYAMAKNWVQVKEKGGIVVARR